MSKRETTLKNRYPDTKTFHWHNENPKGKITTDCLIRAISTGTGIDYNTVVRELTELYLQTGIHFGDKKIYGKYLESKGWKKCKQPRKDDNTKYTGEEFCKEIQTHRHWYSPQIIAHMGSHHIVAIMWGQIYDTWNSEDGCVGVYWEKD